MDQRLIKIGEFNRSYTNCLTRVSKNVVHIYSVIRTCEVLAKDMDINHDLFEPRGERNRQRNYASIAFSREIFNLRLNRLIFTKYQIPEYMELQENV